MAPSLISQQHHHIKRKRMEDGNNYEVIEDDFILNVLIKYADGLDPNNVGPTANQRRTYKVYGGTEEGGELFATREVLGLPDPFWRKIYSMEHTRGTRYLYLEVVRTGSKTEPGTSTGHLCVGRTRVKLPTEPNEVTGGRFGLVWLKESEVIPEGHIQVSLELTKQI